MRNCENDSAKRNGGPPGSALSRRVIQVSAEDVLPPGTSGTGVSEDAGRLWLAGVLGRRFGKSAILEAAASEYVRRTGRSVLIVRSKR